MFASEQMPLTLVQLAVQLAVLIGACSHRSSKLRSLDDLCCSQVVHGDGMRLNSDVCNHLSELSSSVGSLLHMPWPTEACSIMQSAYQLTRYSSALLCIVAKCAVVSVHDCNLLSPQLSNVIASLCCNNDSARIPENNRMCYQHNWTESGA